MSQRAKYTLSIASGLLFLLSFPTLLSLCKKSTTFFKKNPLVFLFFITFLAVNAFVAQHKLLFLYRIWQYGKIFHGTLSKSPCEADFFDVIFMHHVIEHLEKPEEDIKEVKRILKPGGILILGTPDFDSGCARLFGKNYRLLYDGTHISLFSNESSSTAFISPITPG